MGSFSEWNQKFAGAVGWRSLWRRSGLFLLVAVLALEVGTRMVEVQAFSDEVLLDPFHPAGEWSRFSPHPYIELWADTALVQSGS